MARLAVDARRDRPLRSPRRDPGPGHLPHQGALLRPDHVGDLAGCLRALVRVVGPHRWCGRHLDRWPALRRSEEHTSELQSLMRSSYAVFCLKKNKTIPETNK